MLGTGERLVSDLSELFAVCRPTFCRLGQQQRTNSKG